LIVSRWSRWGSWALVLACKGTVAGAILAFNDGSGCFAGVSTKAFWLPIGNGNHGFPF